MQAAELEVSNAFSSIFPDFVAAVPVRYHTVVDKLLRALDDVQLRLLRLDERGRLLQVQTRRLHSSTFRLNVSAFDGIGGAFRGCLLGGV